MSLCSFRSSSTWPILLQMGTISSLLQYFAEQSNIFYDLIFSVIPMFADFFFLSRLCADELYKRSLQEITSSRSEDKMFFGCVICLFVLCVTFFFG